MAPGWWWEVKLEPPWLVRLVRRQQPNHQPNQFASCEHDSSFMLVLAHIVANADASSWKLSQKEGIKIRRILAEEKQG